jgi:hypothetical protein
VKGPMLQRTRAKAFQETTTEHDAKILRYVTAKLRYAMPFTTASLEVFNFDREYMTNSVI